ncbi:MAG: hypothetical protein LBV60_25780 [Streptomyces sp.]|jgi:hypothetical protein|nr:hypothetical protein [Streptomyces sp.]
MPSLATLIDNFNDDAIGPNWGNSYGGCTETGGRARVPCGTGYAGYQTAYSWTLAGATVYVQLPTVPSGAGATEAYCGLLVNSGTDGTRLGFIYNAITGLLRCTNETGYYDPDGVNLTYSATTHKWLRIREDGTNVYWDTSPDGTAWTNRRTLATPAWVTAGVDTCALDMSAHRADGTPDFVEYDFFNTLSDADTITGTATGSAESNATAAGILTTVGTATGTGQATATAAGIPVFIGTAAGNAQSNAFVVVVDNTIPEVAKMAAGDFDLVIEQGSTFVQTYTVKDPGFTWAGWSARAQIRTSAYEAGRLLLDLTPYLTVDGPAVQLAIPAAVTETLTRDGRWDLEMFLGPTVVRILQGAVKVSLEVTR